MLHITAILAMIVVGIAGHAGAAEIVPPATTLNPASDSQAKRGCDLALKHEFTQAMPPFSRSSTHLRPT